MFWVPLAAGPAAEQKQIETKDSPTGPSSGGGSGAVTISRRAVPSISGSPVSGPLALALAARFGGGLDGLGVLSLTGSTTPSPCCSRCGRSHKPPLGFPHSSSFMVTSPGGCLTSLRSRGRRDLQTAIAKFSMSWTSEQNSTHWGGSLWRICCRHKTNKRGCTTGVRGCGNSRWEIRCLCYFQRLVGNSPSTWMMNMMIEVMWPLCTIDVI